LPAQYRAHTLFYGGTGQIRAQGGRVNVLVFDRRQGGSVSGRKCAINPADDDELTVHFAHACDEVGANLAAVESEDFSLRLRSRRIRFVSPSAFLVRASRPLATGAGWSSGTLYDFRWIYSATIPAHHPT
jgi:hypothetical protein